MARWVPLVSWLGVTVGCNSVAPSAIQAPDRYELRDTSPARIGAKALDELGQPLPDVDVYIGGVSDPAVLHIGHNNEVQCRKWGVSTVTLEAPPIRTDVEVRCRLVKELRVAPQTLVTVLDADADGNAIAKELGGFRFQALGLDGKAIKDAPIEVSVGDDGVVRKHQDGTLHATRPGRTTITGTIADHSASLAVEVGLLIATRTSVLVESGDHLGIPVEPGRFRVALGADVALRVNARGGTCEEHAPGIAVETHCTFATAGTVRIENPRTRGADDDAHVTFRLLQIP